MPKYTPKGPISPANEIAYGQELFGELNRLRDLVRDQHGRVLVLSIASFAEECLARLIKAYLRNTKAVDELLEGFNAPLGTFAARIKIASALGLLSGSQFKNLEIMRKVRNEFAHTWDELSFDDAKIKSFTENLDPPRFPHRQPEIPEDKFRAVGQTILSELEVLQSEKE